MIIYRHKLLDCKINNYKIYMIYYTHLYESALKTPFFQITEKRSFAGKM
jgi:hypothetical protein